LLQGGRDGFREQIKALRRRSAPVEYQEIRGVRSATARVAIGAAERKKKKAGRITADFFGVPSRGRRADQGFAPISRSMTMISALNLLALCGNRPRSILFTTIRDPVFCCPTNQKKDAANSRPFGFLWVGIRTSPGRVDDQPTAHVGPCEAPVDMGWRKGN